MHAHPRTLPRSVDVALAALLLVLASPLILLIAGVLALTGRGRVIYTQERLGLAARPFRIHKFRTLAKDRPDDDGVTPTGDERVTRVGAWLRHTRLDELPQLYDVLRGAMALVGPRPETAANLDRVDPALLERWLSVRPGLTGATQLAFIGEDDVLAGVRDPTAAYRQILVPAKVHHGIAWLQTRSARGDLAILVRTPLVLASRRRRLESRRAASALLERSHSDHAVESVASTKPTPRSEPR